MTRDEFDNLTPIRVTNAAGPCVTFYRLVRRNRKSAAVAFWNADHTATRRVSLCQVHTDPCHLCPGGVTYPQGYRD